MVYFLRSPVLSVFPFLSVHLLSSPLCVSLSFLPLLSHIVPLLRLPSLITTFTRLKTKTKTNRQIKNQTKLISTKLLLKLILNPRTKDPGVVNNAFRETRFSDSSLLSLLHEFLLGMKPPLTSLLSYPCGSPHPMPSSSHPRPSRACPTSLTLWLPSSLCTLPPSIPLLPAHLSDSPGRYRLRLCCHPPSPPHSFPSLMLYRDSPLYYRGACVFLI